MRIPFSNALYPFNRIPSSGFNAASVNLQSHFPTASVDAGAGLIGNTVFYAKPALQSFDEHTSRADDDSGAKDLSLIVTTVVFFRLTRNRQAAE